METPRPYDALPDAQAMQVAADEAPTVCEYVPCPHKEQLVEAATAENEPATHGTHVAADEAPLEADEVPAPHAMQVNKAVAPVAAEK